MWHLAGLPELQPLPTGNTISVDAPAKMEKDARETAARGFALLKCKLGGEGDLDGALLLAEDREGDLVMRDGLLHPGTLWGLPR